MTLLLCLKFICERQTLLTIFLLGKGLHKWKVNERFSCKSHISIFFQMKQPSFNIFDAFRKISCIKYLCQGNHAINFIFDFMLWKVVHVIWSRYWWEKCKRKFNKKNPMKTLEKLSSTIGTNPTELNKHSLKFLSFWYKFKTLSFQRNHKTLISNWERKITRYTLVIWFFSSRKTISTV